MAGARFGAVAPSPALAGLFYARKCAQMGSR